MSEQYTPHIKATKDDFAKTVLMPGDPLRSNFIAETFLENPKLINNVRGIQGYTGTYKGVRISVMDTGSGIADEEIPYIWDRYYKSDKNHRRATVGTGLGLSIVKSVMSKHPGGAYGVITSDGEGSTFYIELQRS